jgi:cytoskeletal protein RodZ
MSKLDPSAAEQPMRKSWESSSPSLFSPVLLLMVTWLLWSGFQAMQLLKERSRLEGVHSSQESSVVTAEQMRAQLDALAAGTKQLADSGHPHAAGVVQELARRGITIDPGVID